MKSPITSHVPLIWPSSSWMSVRCGCRKAWGGMCVILIFLRPAFRGFDSCSRQSVIFVTWGAIPWEVEADDWAECVEKTLVNNDAATCYFRPFRFLFAGRGHLRKPDCPPVPCNWRERPTDKKKKKANHENSWSLPVHSSGNRQALRLLLGRRWRLLWACRCLRNCTWIQFSRKFTINSLCPDRETTWATSTQNCVSMCLLEGKNGLVPEFFFLCSNHVSHSYLDATYAKENMLLARCKESPQAGGLIDSTSIKATSNWAPHVNFFSTCTILQLPLFLFPLLDDSIAVQLISLTATSRGKLPFQCTCCCFCSRKITAVRTRRWHLGRRIFNSAGSSPVVGPRSKAHLFFFKKRLKTP